MKAFRVIRNVVVASVVTLGSGVSWAADWQPYTEAAFKDAKAKGQTVVVDFHADWCSTCKKQKPILESLLKQKEFENVIGLSADYDKEKALKKELGIKKQSTVIVFKGAKEINRSTGTTSETELRTQIAAGT